MADPIQQTYQHEPTSRYRATKVFAGTFDTGRRVFFGTWRPPRIVERRAPSIHTVGPDEVRRPDLIAWRVYEDPQMFWPIALRNGIIMPLVDLTVGQRLVCPHADDITSALAKSTEV